MDPFDYVAKMRIGAPAMIARQEYEPGGRVMFTGAEPADVVAFVHNADEHTKFSAADIPMDIIAHLGGIGSMMDEPADN